MDSISLLTDDIGGSIPDPSGDALRKKKRMEVGNLSDEELAGLTPESIKGKHLVGGIAELAGLENSIAQAQARINTRPPNRADIITQVLNEQLDVLKRRRGGLGMTAPMAEPAQEQVASTALFGV